MFFEAVTGAVPGGQVEVNVADVDAGVIDIGWDLLTDVTPRKWQTVPSDFDEVKRDWGRWYLDENEKTLDGKTLLAMYVLADNDLPYETDVNYTEKLAALIKWLRDTLATRAGFDVASRTATVGDVRAALRRYLAELPAPALRALDDEGDVTDGEG